MGKKPHLILLLFLIQIISVHFVISSSYDVDKYFINCGSAQNLPDNRRNFTGDKSRDLDSLFSFTKQRSTSVTTTNKRSLNGTPTIYDTARIFRQQSSYSFGGNASDTTYLVRLHFLAFSSDLSGAVFDVAVSSGALLLHNFSAGNTPSVEEFYVKVNATRFRIYFTPRESSLAFVNAIEFFPSPPGEFDLSGATIVGTDKRFESSSVLQTVYRINVGGERIEPSIDEIWRNWDTDDDFLKTKDDAIDTGYFVGNLKRRQEYSSFAAPDVVYRTATEMNVGANNTNGSSRSLIWSFSVNKSSGHFVRAHFCDVVYTSLDTLHFNFYINGNFSGTMNSMNVVEGPNQPVYDIEFMNQPVYVDFKVGPVPSAVLNISIGPAPPYSNAFLNGLEILEIKQGQASVPMERPAGSKLKLPAVIGAAAGCFAALCVLAGLAFVVVARRSTHSRVSVATTISGSPVPNLNLGLKISFPEIQRDTMSFNSKLIIGRGGFGSVYKGTLPDGTKVAVKRSSPGAGQGLPEFHTEIMILSSIRHRHLVSLVGYCNEKEEMILVYEFMENGTLREHLYNSDRPRLTWKQRLEICIGSASGLNYLHKGSSGRIIHRDVKSTNILLDENLVAKVADFGLSKSGPLDDNTHVSTNVKGTFGYLDPEYFKSQQLTEKSDVYSFGVVLLEILCARPAINTALPREQMNLAEWALRCKSKGVLADIVDRSIKDQINPNSLRKFGETAEKCLQEDGSDRPAMSEVIWDLEYALQLQQTPAPREPHEDSTVATASGFSAAIIAPDFARIPSLGAANDDSYLMSADFTEMSASEVFSQLKRDGGR